MKFVTILLLLLSSSFAIANPFDAFVGEYKVNSTPLVRSINADWCNRFDFKNMTEFKVEKNTNGYKQSHMLYILNPSGWFGHPTMDFNDKNEYGTAGTLAKTTGTASSATNMHSAWSTTTEEIQNFTVKIENRGNDFTLSIVDDLYSNADFVASCTYEVSLLKK